MISKNSEYTATIHVFGNIVALDFPIWILNHAKKLGLHDVKTLRHHNCIEVLAAGPEEMLDALALGCSLGPTTVLVERISHTSSEVA